MIQSCIPVLTKKRCCKYIEVSKIETNEDINEVTFPENPCPGSLYIVQFEDSLVIYKYYNQEWGKVIDQEQSVSSGPSLRTWVGNIINQATFAPEVEEVFSNIGTLPLVDDDVQVYTITGFFLFTGTPLITVIYPHTIDYYGDILYTTVDQVITNNVTPGVNLVDLTITVKDSLGNPAMNIGAILPLQIIVGDNFIETIVE